MGPIPRRINLDDDGFSSEPAPLRVSIKISMGKAPVDFAGSSPACRGSVNVVMAITTSAVSLNVFRCAWANMFLPAPACSNRIRKCAPLEGPEGAARKVPRSPRKGPHPRRHAPPALKKPRSVPIKRSSGE